MPKGYSEPLQKIFQVQEQIYDIHLLLQKVFPIAVVESSRFLIYDDPAGENQYRFIQELPTPMPIPVGIRAAFPLDSYDGRMVCVVTGEVFDSLDGYVTIFHEFIHCQQFETCEARLKDSLGVARKAQAENDFMWEINHPFPFDAPGFVQAYAEFLEITPENDLAAVSKIRQQLSSVLSLEDYEYMVWQEWKEGFARWIENQVQARLGLPKNHGGRLQPFSRVSFYAGGAGHVEFLRNQSPGIETDLEKLFLKMIRV